MTKRLLSILAFCSVGMTAPLGAVTGLPDRTPAPNIRALPPFLQCVPYARSVSGVAIYGDAHTWWGQAAGRYARGTVPKLGAVMNFRPHANSRLGHVAAVSKIIDSRTVLISHSNWSLINGRRGQIERNVRAVDVSPANDWSAVRVWYGPNKALGTTRWPLYGFIYNEKPGRGAALSRAVAARAVNVTYEQDPIGEIIARGRRR